MTVRSLLHTLLNSPRLLFAVGSGFSLSLVACGLVLAYFYQLSACPLCIVQRMLYLLFAFISALGMLPALFVAWHRLLAITGILAASAGLLAAGYQVWIQRVATDIVCGAQMPWWEQLVYWAGEQIPWLFEASGLCSDPAWKFLSLSIAEWSLLCFAGLFGLMLRILLFKEITE